MLNVVPTPESTFDPAEWFDSLADALATMAIDPSCDIDQFQVFVSGAVAEWADEHEQDDLVAAGRSLSQHLAPVSDDAPTAAAVVAALDTLLTNDPDGLEFLEASMLSGLARDVVSYALVFGRVRPAEPENAEETGIPATKAAPTHTLLVDVGAAGEVAGLFFGDADVASAALAEASFEGVAFERTVVTGESLEALRAALIVVFSAPVADENANRANAFVASHRLRLAGVDSEVRVPRGIVSAYEPRPRDADEDRYAAELVRSALGVPVAASSDLLAAAAAFEAEAPDAREFLRVAGWPTHEGDAVRRLVALTGAFVHPQDLSMYAEAERRLLDALEWADWLGALIPAVRAGVGAPMTPSGLVDNINRCPEVTTSIPKRDRPAMEAAFDLVLPAWRTAGVLDADDRLSEDGAWLLTEALRQAATESF